MTINIQITPETNIGKEVENALDYFTQLKNVVNRKQITIVYLKLTSQLATLLEIQAHEAWTYENEKIRESLIKAIKAHKNMILAFEDIMEYTIASDKGREVQ